MRPTASLPDACGARHIGPARARHRLRPVSPTSSASPVPALLRRLVADPGRPRLTWYGTAGERVELSGHVLDNWVTKTTNLLVEEMDAGPGTRVGLDLPAHWRTLVWALAAWRAGSCVLTAPDPSASRVDVAVTTRPDAWTGAPGAPEVVAVELAALARRFAGDLPPSATDAASAVMTYADVLLHAPEPATDDPALEPGTGDDGVPSVTFAGLAGWARDAVADAPWADGVLAGDGRRLMLEPAAGDVPGLLAAALVVLGEGGSLVLVDPASDADRVRVAESERVTDGA